MVFQIDSASYSSKSGSLRSFWIFPFSLDIRFCLVFAVAASSIGWGFLAFQIKRLMWRYFSVSLAGSLSSSLSEDETLDEEFSSASDSVAGVSAGLCRLCMADVGSVVRSAGASA